MARASISQKTERLNLARALLQQHQQLPSAAELLARQCSISKRQAYRYLEQAQQLKRPLPVERLRTYAASTGMTLSEIVSRAVLTVLHRGGGRG